MKRTGAALIVLLMTLAIERTSAFNGPYPIILIHGFCSDSQIWDAFASTVQLAAPNRFGDDGINRLYFDGSQVLSHPFFLTNTANYNMFSVDFYDSDNQSFDRLSVANVSADVKVLELKRVIDAIKLMTGHQRVVLVGHSMGGLVARDYVEGTGGIEYEDDVERIITLDTPHSGSAAANWSIPEGPCFAQSSVNKSELAPSSDYIDRLNFGGLPQWLPSGIVSISSYVENSPTGQTAGDGVVSYDSQNLTTVYPFNMRVKNVPNGTYPTSTYCVSNFGIDLACQIHTVIWSRPTSINLIWLAIQEADRLTNTTHVWTSRSVVPLGTLVQISATNLDLLRPSTLWVRRPTSNTKYVSLGTGVKTRPGEISWTFFTSCSDPNGGWGAVVRDPRSWVRGEFNGDGIVNSIDFSILNANWFKPDAYTDINGDGLVNSIDFSILNSNWFKSGPAMGVTFSVTPPTSTSCS